MEQTNALSWRTKISFGLGAFGKDLVYAIVGTYFMKYLTDTRGVDPLFVGVLFMAARIWDAFNDPFMGVIVDNTRSRFGKFRPWILIGTIINAVVLVLLYLDVDLSPMNYAIYVAVMYILWGMTYTIMDIPYWSMVPALTDNPSDRAQISTIPRFFASTAWLAVGSGGLYIVKYFGGGNDVLGFSRFAMAIAVIFVGTTLITVFNTRERRVATADVGGRTGVRDMLRILFRNDQAMVVLGIALFFNIAYQLTTSFALYYFEYVCGIEDALFATYSSVAGFAQMGALLSYPFISSKIPKKYVAAAATLLPVPGYAALLVAGYLAPTNILFVGVSSAIVNIGIGFMLVLITVILSESVDYGEYKLGTRNESVIFSVQTFVVKFAGAFSGLISGAGLKLIGFQAGQPAGPTVALGMRIIMIVIPAVLSVLCLVVYKSGYKLNDRFYAHVLETIREKENGGPAGEEG